MKVLALLSALSAFLVGSPLFASNVCTSGMPESFYTRMRVLHAHEIPSEKEALTGLNARTEFKGDGIQLRQTLVRIFHSAKIQSLVSDINLIQDERRSNWDERKERLLMLEQSQSVLRVKGKLYNQVKAVFGPNDTPGLHLYLALNSELMSLGDEMLKGFYFRVAREGEEGPWYNKVGYKVSFDGTVIQNSITGITEVCTVGGCLGFAADGRQVDIPYLEAAQGCSFDRVLIR